MNNERKNIRTLLEVMYLANEITKLPNYRDFSFHVSFENPQIPNYNFDRGYDQGNLNFKGKFQPHNK